MLKMLELLFSACVIISVYGIGVVSSNVVVSNRVSVGSIWRIFGYVCFPIAKMRLLFRSFLGWSVGGGLGDS